MAKAKKPGKQTTPLTKEAVFARLNESAERTLWALTQAYEAGVKKGFEVDEEDQLIELLKRAKRLKEEVKRITQESQGKGGHQS